MDKNEKKKILKELKERKKINFENSLPMSRDLFVQLFDFLDKKLTDNDCSGKPSFTMEFLIQKNIECEPILSWLSEHGGYCDCEISYNTEEKFRDCAIL